MYTDSEEPVETSTRWEQIWDGDWFRLRTWSSKEVTLKLDENTGKDRQLKFTVHHYNGSASAVVTQLGAASQK